jgi:hypothetical protein
MSFNINFTFDGLCVFVPSKKRKRMRVILVNATSPYHESSHHGAGISMPSHYPFISYSTRNRIKDIGEPAQVLINGGREVRFFDWEDLILTHGYTGSPLIYGAYTGAPNLNIVGGRVPGTSEPATGSGSQARDFSWVAELERINPGAGRVKRSCLAPDPPRDLVIGRMDLREGEIFTQGLVEEATGINAIFEFADPDAAGDLYSQALAAEINWTIKIDEAYVILRFQRFGVADIFSETWLEPVGHEDVNVRVGNLPLEEVLGMNVRLRALTDSLAHFEQLYRVARKPPAVAPIPEPIGHSALKSGGGVRGGTTMCLGLTLLS